MVYGSIICEDSGEFIENGIDFRAVKLCADNNFGISFTGCRTDRIDYSLSDGFIVKNCDKFMDGIFYEVSHGETEFPKLEKDVSNIVSLFELFFSLPTVQSITLYISFGEEDEDEFKVYRLKLEEVKNTIISEYKNAKFYPDIPTIKLVVLKHVKETSQYIEGINYGG